MSAITRSCPDTYLVADLFCGEFVGNVTEVTKQIGNAVPVGLAAALVKAALGQGMDR